MQRMTLTVEYVTHALSSGRHGDNHYDSFERDPADNIIWRQPWWHAAILKTIELTGMRGLKPAYFYFEPAVKAETELFKRKYGRDKFRMHESIMPGSKMTVKALVDDTISEEQARDLFVNMGRFVGLSPFGHNLGYGKFEVVNFELNRSGNDGITGTTTTV